MKLYFCGTPGENYGWGVCTTNLIKELSALCEVEIVDRTPVAKLPGPAFMPIVDYHFTPNLPDVKAKKMIGYCFTEAPLDAESRKNAYQYDLIFAGSTWNKQRIKDAGIKVPCEVLIQGVDHSVFAPQPPTERKGFVVFSGGKYEFRKAQDYVACAMKHFMAVRHDAVLLTSWHNHWPNSKRSMAASWLVDNWQNPVAGMDLARVLDLNLSPEGKPAAIPNAMMPKVYQMAHVGLFPNRCEAGTNLVMMEMMACARPVIASYATGQKDVLDPAPHPFTLRNGDYDPAGWFNPHVSDIICGLEWAYTHREELQTIGQANAERMKQFTWKRCAEKIFQAAFNRSSFS